MRLVVLGATGGTGAAFVAQALEAGHTVTAVARKVSAFPLTHERLRVVRGDVMDAASLPAIIADHDAVVSTVGTASKQKTSLFSAGVANTITAMRLSGVRRLVAVSSSALTSASPALGSIWLYNRVIGPILFGNQYADMRCMEGIVRASGTDWTLVRPSRLLDGERRGTFRRSTGSLKRGMVDITGADVAAFMLACIGDDTTVQQAIAIAY